MPGLTVTEKEYWKDRIGKWIDKMIETGATNKCSYGAMRWRSFPQTFDRRARAELRKGIKWKVCLD